jgi:MYXO-CTERM domain-containing protein
MAWIPSPLLRVMALAGLLVALATPPAAAAERVACLARPGPQDRSGGGPRPDLGPCQSPDAVDYFATGSAGRGIVVTNFGLLMPGDRLSSWQVVCDDNFGVGAATQVRIHPDGRVFAPSNEGLYFSADGCTWSQGQEAIAGKIVFDVAFDRQTQSRVYALGEIPRRLWRSTDGGQSFNLLQEFDQTIPFHRVVVAPSDGNRIYLVGRGRGASTPLARSLDGGESFEMGDLALGTGSAPPMNPLEFVAAAPDDPSVLYFYVINTIDGDEIWRTSDGGKTAALVLRMPDDAFAGFSFGATSQTIFVAGMDPFPFNDKPPARLYVSHDGGTSWDEPLPSPQTGPRYRCLTWADGKLYACGTGEPGGDDFLVGVSSDEGKTWAPAVRLGQLAGAKSCVQARCLQVEEWLCVNYCYCAPGTQPGGGCAAPVDTDAGAPDIPRPGSGDAAAGMRSDQGSSRDAGGPTCQGTACQEKPAEKQGCSCSLGRPGAGAPPSAWPVVLLLLGGALAGRNRFRHHRR